MGEGSESLTREQRQARERWQARWNLPIIVADRAPLAAHTSRQVRPGHRGAHVPVLFVSRCRRRLGGPAACPSRACRSGPARHGRAATVRSAPWEGRRGRRGGIAARIARGLPGRASDQPGVRDHRERPLVGDRHADDGRLRGHRADHRGRPLPRHRDHVLGHRDSRRALSGRSRRSFTSTNRPRTPSRATPRRRRFRTRRRSMPSWSICRPNLQTLQLRVGELVETTRWSPRSRLARKDMYPIAPDSQVARASGIVPRTVVPRPGEETISSSPPTAPTRSRIPIRPSP